MAGEQISGLIDEFASGLKKHSINTNHSVVSPWRYSDPLVCPDLEMIFELCASHNLQVVLTTNAVSFTEPKCRWLVKYTSYIKQINISIIGYNREEIREYMDIDWNVTKERLKMIKEKYPELSKKMNIGIKHKIQHPEKKQYGQIVNKIQKLTLGKVKVKKDWLENRLVYNKFDDDGINFSINEKNFVKGCSMVHGKILRRLEIMVDGTAVLCCDDATKQTNFGNVFELGMASVWNNLREYHNMLYSDKWQEEKKNMMCNTCSRARFSWDTKQSKDVIDYNKHFTNA